MKDANRSHYQSEKMNEQLIAPNRPTYWLTGTKKISQGNTKTGLLKKNLPFIFNIKKGYDLSVISFLTIYGMMVSSLNVVIAF
jgi:hypothetical protein